MTVIKTIDELEALYGAPGEASIVKEIDHVAPVYRRYIEASPFVLLATAGPEGLDCSPRGDLPGFVRVRDDKTLMMPDRRGNNRVDSLRNIVRDPRVALLFLVPGIGNTLRVNGRAHVTVDPALLNGFEMDGKAPRSLVVVRVDTVFFQCARALLRSDLWNPERHLAAADVPSAGEILAELSNARVGGETYDREWPERARKSLW
jgi:PPOX class probable FMN-dependent enzyme